MVSVGGWVGTGGSVTPVSRVTLGHAGTMTDGNCKHAAILPDHFTETFSRRPADPVRAR